MDMQPEENKEKEKVFSHSKRSRHASQPDPSFPVLFDYDEYDRQVFRASCSSQNIRQTLSLQRPTKRKETPPHSSGYANICPNQSSEEISRWTASEPPPVPNPYFYSHASSPAIAIPQHRRVHAATINAISYQGTTEIDRMSYRPFSRDDTESEQTPPYRSIVGSDPSYESQCNKHCLTRKLKALVNPFNPSQITIKLTSNRRRWTHVFPLGGLEYKSNIAIKKDIHSSVSNMSFNAMDVRSSSSSGRVSVSMQNSDSLLCLSGGFGEQEWTPAVTTGVDWKSLVIPACLPITTDYFPDRRSLQNDYVISDYSLLPEDIIAENAHPRYFQNDDDNARRPLTTPEVYHELIFQRLQQGFQIILLPKQHSSYSLTQISSSPQYSSSILKGQSKSEHPEECLLSIGRIFHKLNLDVPCITVTQYRPRHPHREIKVHYCYRFHAPDSDTYGVSWVNFTSERLENYNWNYSDHYICMRGEGEFELKDSQKYWRLRMLLLPSAQPETKKIIDGSSYCDLYNKFSNEDKISQRDSFLKFVEVMNKIKRNLASKKPKLSLFPPRRSSVGNAALNALTSSLKDKMNNSRIHDRPRMRSNSARMGARPEPIQLSGRVSPATEADGRIILPKSDKPLITSISGENLDDSFPTEIKRLSESSTELEILQGMQHPQDGLNFLSKTGWPALTFISAEAVSWITTHVEGIFIEQRAVKLLQSFIDKDLICHVSRSKEHSFIYGFYLYYIVSAKDKENCKVWNNDELDEREAIYLFEREWLEVELSSSLSISAASENYNFPSDEDIWTTPYYPTSKLKFKCCNIQIEQGVRSGRQEWGQLRYQNLYTPYEAFEIVVEWMVATGNKAAELVQSWARKSNQYGFQLVPIPSDPFALPFSDDSDPLRGPIFIPLDLSCLMDTSVQSLDEEGLLKLQEKILCKFGFIPYRNPNISSPPQYVHVSGSMFIMLPVRVKETKKMNGKHLAAIDLHQISSPHDEYITRHFSGVKNKRLSALNAETDTKIGFLWSWNYMITKRWKNAGTVDENFMRKVMRDFRAFCSNQNSRLEDFWKFSEMSEFGQDHNMLMDLES